MTGETNGMTPHFPSSRRRPGTSEALQDRGKWFLDSVRREDDRLLIEPIRKKGLLASPLYRASTPPLRPPSND
jgi:hypothetical protein